MGSWPGCEGRSRVGLWLLVAPSSSFLLTVCTALRLLSSFQPLLDTLEVFSLLRMRHGCK
uniref:Uncharacterized protein n=1 Tax=Physcomitrium patens TaxID=3218 RepID=A0A2K1K3M4_PHYPA|nr:hypothetical protein PHYPA_012858 [Physcomitrium patens]